MSDPNEIAAMADILSSFNEVDDTQTIITENVDEIPSSPIAHNLMETNDIKPETLSAFEKMYGEPSSYTEEPTLSKTMNSSPKFELFEHKVQGFKNTFKYDIELSGHIIVEGMMLKEAASALCRLLNEGQGITSQYSLHLLGEGLRYSQLMEKAMKSKKLTSNGKLNENMLRGDSKSLLAEAKKCKTDVRNFLFDNNLI